MNEVKKCSLSGVAFTMDIDAYETLDEYIGTLKKSYADSADGAEIVADIEARIAELILSVQDNTRVVNLPLILDIIHQMGSAEDISDTDPAGDRRGPRIPRRLYRDTENAKLGGVCSGIGKYFDIDPSWARLALFLPLLLTCMQTIPVLRWLGPTMGNLFGVFIICYLIMWFTVPAARTARQKLEMNGERITERSIRQTTERTASDGDPDSRAKPLVAQAVSSIGQIVLILCKLLAGAVVFGLILTACMLIIGLFAIAVGGRDMLIMSDVLGGINLWIPILGIIVALLLVILLIYVTMCMIASRKPGGKTILGIFLVWILCIVALGCLAVREHAVDRVRQKIEPAGRMLDREVIIEGDTTTLRQMFEEFEDEKIVEDNLRTVHISVPSKQIEIVVDKEQSRMDITAGGKQITLYADEADNEAVLRMIEKSEKES